MIFIYHNYLKYLIIYTQGNEIFLIKLSIQADSLAAAISALIKI